MILLYFNTLVLDVLVHRCRLELLSFPPSDSCGTNMPSNYNFSPVPSSGYQLASDYCSLILFIGSSPHTFIVEPGLGASLHLQFCLLVPLPRLTGYGILLLLGDLLIVLFFCDQRGVFSFCFPSLEGTFFQLSLMLRHFLCHFLSVHADLMAVSGSTMSYLLVASSRPFLWSPLPSLRLGCWHCCLRLACTFLLTCTFWIDSNCLYIFSTFCVFYMSLVFHT